MSIILCACAHCACAPHNSTSLRVLARQVFFELIGERGPSGAVVLAAAAPTAFRSGAADAFTFPLLPARGALTWLRVGTDGTGLLPGWHLRCDAWVSSH